MKTLIINGSPRKDGYCAQTARYLKDISGAECRIINCHFEDIAHCSGCGGCENGECVIDDGMKKLYPLIEQADKIIFISPLYFSMLTGAFLTFASRWQYFYANPIKGGKKGAVILIGGGSTKDTSKAYSTAKIIMRYAGIKDPQCAAFIGTDNASPFDDANFIKKLHEAAGS